MQQAQDTFTAEMPDGSPIAVTKGEVLPDDHYLVQLDAGRGLLFKPFSFGEETPKARVARAARPAKAGK